MRLELPALRERKEDLEDLVPFYVAEYNATARRQVMTIPEPAWSLLKRHDWPGNVRELRNVIERYILLSNGPELPVEWLQLRPAAAANEAAGAETVRAEASGANGRAAQGNGTEVAGSFLRLPLDGSMRLEYVDRYIIGTTLKRQNHNVTAAARAPGTTRNTLRYRVQKFGLQPR